MTAAHDLLQLLADAAPVPYCFDCLAQQFPTLDVRAYVAEDVSKGGPLVIRQGRCSRCLRFTSLVAHTLPEGPRHG